VVLITHPRQLILCTGPRHIVSGPDELRVRVWSQQPLAAVDARIDDAVWQPMRDCGGGNWKLPIGGDVLAKGEHTAEVRASAAEGGNGGDRLVFQVDRSGRFPAVPRVEPAVKETRFC
jgi:3',5'-cyclic-AMP phosphodiesterase